MFTVIKADKKTEPFSEEKVIASIKRARIPETVQADALNHVKTKLYEGITTQEIYHHILEFLDKTPHQYNKSRYSLKEAIMTLGPSGYPFEDYVGKLLEEMGYKTRVRQILNGRCVTHEIDVVAEKDNKTAIIEAKFHNSPGTRSDVHVALYTQARFEDVQVRNKIDEVWLVTNTKSTVDANTYAQCIGMKVISWDFPERQGLREMIEETRLYPITMLTSLSQSNKMTLLNNHIVLCKQIQKDNTLLTVLPLTKDERDALLAEIAFLSS